MKKQTMTAVVALTIMMSLPALANEASMKAASGTGDVPVHKTHVVRDAAREIKAFFLGETSLEPVLIKRNSTAEGLIGQTVINTTGHKVATLKDIIVDSDGKAILVVVSDGGFLGIGKKVAAFDYDDVVSQQADGKVVMQLSEDMVAHAADFSYDQKDWKKANIIPVGSLSVKALLKSDVLDSDNDKVASVENIYFRSAEASQLIIGFNKKLGMGGDYAAVDYDDVQTVKDGDAVDFKLTAHQSALFAEFKKSVADKK